MATDVICDAIHLIRAETDRGTINMNTNGSMPDKIARLLGAGLDSLRISINSVRKPCYEAYFRPRGYVFEDVIGSIDTALQHGAHVAINYLNCPGFTDTPEEFHALLAFLQAHPIHMIQWRNLNFDPVRYLDSMNSATVHSAPLGVTTVLNGVRQACPKLRHGYFNPPKDTFF